MIRDDLPTPAEERRDERAARAIEALEGAGYEVEDTGVTGGAPHGRVHLTAGRPGGHAIVSVFVAAHGVAFAGDGRLERGVRRVLTGVL